MIERYGRGVQRHKHGVKETWPDQTNASRKSVDFLASCCACRAGSCWPVESYGKPANLRVEHDETGVVLDLAGRHHQAERQCRLGPRDDRLILRRSYLVAIRATKTRNLDFDEETVLEQILGF